MGDVRGRGLLVGVEFVADRDTKRPVPRAAKLTEAIIRNARESGLLVYSGVGCADGTNGDMILLGPPFVVTDEELVSIADRLGAAAERAAAEAGLTG